LGGNTPPLAVINWKPPGLEEMERSVEGFRIVVSENRNQLLDYFAEAEIAFVAAFDKELLQVAKNLRWIHAGSAGVEGYLFPELVESQITLTCSKPCFESTGAEYALAVMLTFSRQLHTDLRHRPDQQWEWDEPGTLRSDGQWPVELKGKTIGILGLGVMGLEIARMAHYFGMHVIGLAKHPRTTPQYVDQLVALPQIENLLESSDFVILSLPLTPETKGFFDQRKISLMKKTAYFIDVSGRPSLYDLNAIQQALIQGQLAGANLQLELPSPDSSLWNINNLLMSFHRIVSKEEYQRVTDLFFENLKRYSRGQKLLGLVNKVAGY
jgi:phosphoglycerate dehydrogenase-like enzyme